MSVLRWCALGIPLAHLFLFAGLGLTLLLWRAPSERVVSFVSVRAFDLAWLTTSVTSVLWFAYERVPTLVHVGEWFSAGEQGFTVTLLLDTLSLVMALLVNGLLAIVVRFARTYLHREPGFARFHLLVGLFGFGMNVLVLGGALDILFAGWEIVGLTSMLLIAFFHERAVVVRNTLRVFTTYRLCDLGLLVASVILHQESHGDDFLSAFAFHPSHAHSGWVTVFALCMLLGASGKSALFPVGTWLPRAMEGPTVSSALFYGGLSVHAGVYALLRVYPLIAHASAARVMIGIVGLLTALYGAVVGSVQPDAKGSIAFGTMSHVGVMVLEIAVGIPMVALVHLVLHASLRTFQMLRAPSAIADAAELRTVWGGELPSKSPWFLAFLPLSVQQRLWTLVFARFHLEALHEAWLVHPIVHSGDLAEAMEERWDEFVGGHARAESSTSSPRKVM